MCVWSTLSWWRVSPWHMLTPSPWQNHVCLIGVTANPSLLQKTYDFYFFFKTDRMIQNDLVCPVLYFTNDLIIPTGAVEAHVLVLLDLRAAFMAYHHIIIIDLKGLPDTALKWLIPYLSTWMLQIHLTPDMLQIRYWHEELWSSSCQCPRSSTFWISMLLLSQIIHCHMSFHSELAQRQRKPNKIV